MMGMPKPKGKGLAVALKASIEKLEEATSSALPRAEGKPVSGDKSKPARGSRKQVPTATPSA
jgi:hypothetical protein